MTHPEYIHEGFAKIYKNGDAFYNPAQQFNRELTLEVLKAFIKNRKDAIIFEAMGATGLRTIRFMEEIEEECEIIINDRCKKAVNMIISNLKLNGAVYIERCRSTDDTNIKGKNLKCIGEKKEFEYVNKKISVINDNCNVILHANKNYFDIIDIDPYGSCAEFVDGALNSIKNGGLLCLTSTDTAVLCSNKRKCQIRYGIVNHPGCAHHEQSLRILLAFIAKSAGKYGKSIEPLLSLSIDFYVRVFVRVINKHADKLITDLSYFFICQCYNFKKIKNDFKDLVGNENICGMCGNNFFFTGPFYTNFLHNKEFIKTIITSFSTRKDVNERMLGFLNLDLH